MVNKTSQKLFPTAQDDVLECLVLSTSQRHSVKVKMEERNQKTLTFEKLESENFDEYNT